MKVFLDSIGCRLNQSEIEKLAGQFRAGGHEIVESADEADLVVVNTCAVTGAAASDSRQKIRQAARSGHARIAVTGCWSTLDAAGAAALPRVEWVVSNAEKDHLLSAVLGEEYDLEPLVRQPLPGAHKRTRAFIKVQDGCDNHCTFCVTRLARGAGRSVPLVDVLDDVRAALAGGTHEIVLSGVHLGSWGQDFNPAMRLTDLVRGLLDAGGFQRLRLSSLEPWDLDAAFFDLWQDARMCRHLHLPLQSGSAGTLRRMARKTTPGEFSALLAQARAADADMAITTDLIVGFPGETDAEFEESLAFVRECAFAGGHVFTFSPRPGTAAARLPGAVPPPLRKLRSARMREALAQSAAAFAARFIGREMSVLWETASPAGDGWMVEGLTDNYLRVSARAARPIWNSFSRVRLTGTTGNGLRGDIMDE